MLNKSLLTNIVCLLIIIIGYISPVYNDLIKSVGYFAISGSITNWLAIYMLFEKIPFLYGSGVIPTRFEEFKLGIKKLIFEEFFNQSHIEEVLSTEFGNNILDSDTLSNKINFDELFNQLVKAIVESPIGSMLAMVGGEKALSSIKEPVITKLREIIPSIIKDLLPDDKSNYHAEIISKVEKIVDSRLEKLTSQMVKIIIQDMIRKHLDWLVVWGGVFGGIIGVVPIFIK